MSPRKVRMSTSVSRSWARRAFSILHARAAVRRDLVDASTFHEAQADVGMPQAIHRSRLAVAIEAKIQFIQDGFEKLAMPPNSPAFPSVIAAATPSL